MSLTNFVLAVLCVAVACVYPTGAQETNGIRVSLSRMAALAYTESFPEVDRIELYTLDLDHQHEGKETEAPSQGRFKIGDKHGFGGASSIEIFADVVSRVTIEGKKCKEITDAWRSLTFQPNGAMCHTPPYGVQFYRDNKMLFETTVCWECNNFYLPEIDPETGEMKLLLYGFKNDSRARKLLSIFQKQLPIPKRKK